MSNKFPPLQNEQNISDGCNLHLRPPSECLRMMAGKGQSGHLNIGKIIAFLPLHATDVSVSWSVVM